MIRSRLVLFTACLIGLQLSGCSITESPRITMRKLTGTHKPVAKADEDEDEDEDEQEGKKKRRGDWDFVGEEGRGNVQRETQPAHWYDMFMSEKALEIEHSLGVDH